MAYPTKNLKNGDEKISENISAKLEAHCYYIYSASFHVLFRFVHVTVDGVWTRPNESEIDSKNTLAIIIRYSDRFSKK